MQITIEKKINETLEVKPGCYKDTYGCFCMINKVGVMTRIGSSTIAVYSPGESSYDNNVAEVMSGEPISQTAFLVHYMKMERFFTSNIQL